MEELLSFSGLVTLTVGLTEVIKRAKLIPDRFIPLLAIVLGFGLIIIANWANITSLTIIAGIAVGLSACGLFDLGSKTVLGK